MYDSHNYEGSLNREVGGAAKLGPPVQGYALNVLLPCSVCHNEIAFLSKSKMPPPALAKKLRDKGWRIGKHLVCPSCVKTRPNAIKSSQPMPQNTPPAVTKVDSLASLDLLFQQPKAEEDKPATKEELLGSLTQLFAEKPQPKAEAVAAPVPIKAMAAPVAPKPAEEAQKPSEGTPTPALSKAARAAVMRALEDGFRPVEGLYSAGLSDAILAAKCGVEKSQVAQLRSEWFGELRDSPELLEARAKVEIARKELEEWVAAAKQTIAQKKAHLTQLRREVARLES